MSMNEVVKKLSQAIDKQADKAKTTAYDTPATVRRIEGDTAWVHIPGGVDETPVKLTISAKEGDQVQVRVSGGSAFMVGNGTNPPTDDTTAIISKTIAQTAQAMAEEAKESADAVEGLAQSANANATTAITLADGINDHFWTDSAGAHVTEDTQEDYATDPSAAGGNTLITSAGMAIRHGTTQLAAFTSDGVQIGQPSAERIVITPDNFSAYNANSVRFFDVDYNGGAVSTTGTFEVGVPGQVFNFSGSSIELTTASVDTSNLQPGTTVSFSEPSDYTSSIYFWGSELDDSQTPVTVNASVGAFDTALGYLYFKPASLPNITIGTDSSTTVSIKATYSNDITKTATFSMTIAHDSAAQMINVTATLSKTWTGNFRGSIACLCNYKYSVNTPAPALTFGTNDSTTKGDFSSSFGEGLYTTGTHQTSVGKFNEEDSNNDYAFIVGNGTDDNNRSNAMTVDWNGDLTDGSGNTLSTLANQVSAINTLLANPTESVTLTRGTPSTGTAIGIYDKVSNTVRINFRCSHTSNLSVSTNLFVLDNLDYAPSTTRQGSVMEMNSSSVAGIGQCTINSSGQVRQGASSSARYVLGVIEYVLD